METKESLKNETPNDTQEDTGILRFEFHPDKRDKAMEGVIQSYTTEMRKWFEQDGIWQENPIRHATQGLWYSLYLEKKRLESRRCKKQYTVYKEVFREPLEEDKHYRYGREGNYTACEINQMTRMEKQYSRDGVVIGRESQRSDLIYHILSSKNKEGQYICQNCGAEQELDRLLDGCDYCKSKFDISVYEDKVVSVTSSQGRFDDRETSGFKAYSKVTGLIFVVWGIIGIPFTCGLSLIGTAYGAYVLNKGAKSKRAKQTYDSWQRHLLTKQEIEKSNPNFPEEEFIGSLDCKLKSIHYASDVRELTAFVKCDVAPYVKAYQDIISCEIDKIAYKNFWTDGAYQYIELHRQIDVKKDDNGRLVNGSGPVAVTLAKKLSAKPKNEVTMYRCNGCGTTISLVEGGKCKYCGNEMDYAAYDWIIVSYRHVNEL